MTLLKLIACTLLTVLLLVSFSDCADICSWETSSNSKSYSFNLITSVGHNHGLRSEDGFYKISEKEADGSVTIFWFQPCEHMKFNYDAPMCDNCESCGGPLHCGETCSALLSTSTGGFPTCTTLGFASNQSYSLINPDKPEVGVTVRMIAVSTKKSCSLSIAVYCSLKNEELPSVITKDAPGKCDYTTSIHHSAGCPIVTSVKGGGMGWFGTLLIVLLCGLIVYFAVGIAYRMTVLGVSGLEAFPHLDFWKALPHNIQLGFEAVQSFVTTCYRRFTEPTYTRQ
ncbi:hypothetical protein MPTK1_5g09570 [Marchantia polymorpha subsp. ruderalis]|uniref:Autophagy-related protein 27 n=2 Tax=Marchantia polymorpha TaxID=3197 RepID=A0AAF6BGM6_MARPO|nr:hypothetical protein MARPO_0095s0003 [Marchantia polymorpha]PTQ32738.1 hypothetical protein MARPO_0095s0003 [Marchantia polymorpha]BBN11160.1 hypothetical protein Mp_5g09570 [Marchantia polymorpha subsp. ruderalis]BBN11161.1 hypothetical protein Mp_5g09570 [Marchantia polymorpha subsp. ruderalis]|eukprot:PTQ32737.1 hypothetical protein MARPO_0095s0003 [Marchantia polymorpha]